MSTADNTAYTLRANALAFRDIAPFGRNVVYAGNVIGNEDLFFSSSFFVFICYDIAEIFNVLKRIMLLMKTSVEHLLSKENLTPDDIEKEVDFLQKALGDARKTGKIDIATYLDVGPVTTSLRMIVSMMRHWKPEARYNAEQVRDELRKIHSRMLEVEQKYPGIEKIIEEHRKKEVEKKERKRSRQVRFRVPKHRKRVQKNYVRKRYF